MKAFVAIAAALLVAGCGAYQFPGTSPSSTSSGMVHGTVLSVPCAPVERVDSPCAGRSVAGLNISYVRDGNVAGRAVTDSGGRYTVELAPGTYTVKLDTYMRVVSGPPTVTIAGGSDVEADYILDNGIRVPVPQD